MAGDKMREDQLQAIWFAAGMAAFMACIERAVVVSLFTHWRVWAFLALNLLLLAILFTSKSQVPSSEVDGEDGDSSEVDKNTARQEDGGNNLEFIRTKRRQECEKIEGRVGSENEKLLNGVEYKLMNAEDDGKEEAHDQLSKDELNQRAEAFIAMFRQHLVSDGKGKSFAPSKRRPGQVNSPRRLSFSKRG